MPAPKIERFRNSRGEVTLLEVEIEAELKALAAVQARYDYLGANLARRPDRDGQKARIAKQLAAPKPLADGRGRRRSGTGSRSSLRRGTRRSESRTCSGSANFRIG